MNARTLSIKDHFSPRKAPTLLSYVSLFIIVYQSLTVNGLLRVVSNSSFDLLYLRYLLYVIRLVRLELRPIFQVHYACKLDASRLAGVLEDTGKYP